MKRVPDSPDRRQRSRIRWVDLLPALLVIGGCATLPVANVTEKPDGNLLVEVEEAQSFRALAISVYDDAQLAPAIADLSGMPYAEGVSAGTVLTLPPKAIVKRKLEGEHEAAKLFEQGTKASRAGDWASAAEKFRRAMELDPNRADVRHQLGLALLRTGDVETAYSLLQAAMQESPYDSGTRYALGSVLRARGDLEAALEEYEAAINLDESNGPAAYDRARTLHDLGRYEEARRAYQKFLYAFPSSPLADPARRSLEELSEP